MDQENRPSINQRPGEIAIRLPVTTLEQVACDFRKWKTGTARTWTERTAMDQENRPSINQRPWSFICPG